MRTEITPSTSTPVKKLTRIFSVALAMVLTLGVAVAGAGKAESIAISRPQVRPVSALMAPVMPRIAITEVKAQPELLHEATVATVRTAESHRRIMKMVVTAYCPCSKCCGPDACGITASGKLVDFNGGRFVAADSSLNFGTKLLIPGYDTAPVEVTDRGGAIKGNRIDVFFPSHQQALEWGRRTVQVTVLE